MRGELLGQLLVLLHPSGVVGCGGQALNGLLQLGGAALQGLQGAVRLLVGGEPAGVVGDGLLLQGGLGVLQPHVHSPGPVLHGVEGPVVDGAGAEVLLVLLHQGLQAGADRFQLHHLGGVLLGPLGVGARRLQACDVLLGGGHGLLHRADGGVLLHGLPGLLREDDSLGSAVPCHVLAQNLTQGADGQVGGAVVADGVDDVALLVQHGPGLAVYLDGHVRPQVGGNFLHGGGGHCADGQSAGECQCGDGGSHAFHINTSIFIRRASACLGSG